MPMVRAAVRFTSATVTMSMTCCSPGTRRRLTRFAFPSNSSRMALTAACSSPRPGMKATLTLRESTLLRLRVGVCSATMRRICAASTTSFASPRTTTCSPTSESTTALSGNATLISRSSTFERLLEGLHLGLQTSPLFQHVQRGAFRIGQDHDHVAQRPVLPLVVGIARIGEPQVQHGPAHLLADDGEFLVGDDLKAGHVFVGDVDASRFLAQDDHLGPADDDLDRVLGGDLPLDELPVLSLDLRRGLGGAQSRRKPQRRQTELGGVERRCGALKGSCRFGRRQHSQGPSARRLRARKRRSTRSHDFRAARVLREVFRRASRPRLAAGRGRHGADNLRLKLVGPRIADDELRRRRSWRRRRPD